MPSPVMLVGQFVADTVKDEEIVQADDLRLLFDYSYAATGRILDAASRLTTEEFTTPPPLQGSVSLRHTLVHTLWAEQAWREGLRTRGADEVEEFAPEAFPDVATLAQAWHADEAKMRAWLDPIDDTDLSATAFEGVKVWMCLAHLLNHSTQHRSEAAMILTHWGQSPGELDLTFYLRGWSDD